MSKSSKLESTYVLEVEIVKKTSRNNDKKLAIIMLLVIAIVAMFFFWIFLHIILFVIRMSNALPHFLDEGGKIVTERVRLRVC